MSIQLTSDRLEIDDDRNVQSNVNRNVRWRPHVSVRKPQKCDATKTPTNPTELMNPCSATDISKSHLAAVITYDMLWFSMTTQIEEAPATARTKYWNRPVPIYKLKVLEDGASVLQIQILNITRTS